MAKSVFLTLVVTGIVAGCSGEGPPESPPRADDAVPVPSETSVIGVPVEADASLLKRMLERQVPKTLWRIDQHYSRCVPPQKVKLFGKKINVTPKLGCDVVGKVTRGPIRLRGRGKDIIVELPLRATVSARDIGGVFKGETATGSAMAYARIRLGLAPDWSPRAKVRLRYDWTDPPGIDFLGQRILFTQKADRSLKPVIRDLERNLPRELEKLQLRSQVEALWRHGFTTISLNPENPPVWMRMTPQTLHYGGYALTKDKITLNLGLKVMTETFVGQRPSDPEFSSLPPPDKESLSEGLNFFIPVVADYKQLEPVILRALKVRQARPFVLPAIGEVMARFDSVEAYGTKRGRLAVGIVFSARPAASSDEPTSGKVWLTALPRNEAGSARVAFDNVEVTGDSDGFGGDLVIRLAGHPSFAAPIAAALEQNFAKDIEVLQGKVSRAIAENRSGSLLIESQIEEFQTGALKAYGQGLYIPVRAKGTAQIHYLPGN